MKIYFAGSIRGGREDGELYKDMISFVRQYGPVLTEHVGDDRLLHAEKKCTEQEIFDRDMDWLEQADVVVAEVTTPSLGVGYELARAEQIGKKVLCLFRAGGKRDLSAMVAGNAYFQVVSYKELAGACEKIAEFMDTV